VACFKELFGDNVVTVYATWRASASVSNSSHHTIKMSDVTEQLIKRGYARLKCRGTRGGRDRVRRDSETEIGAGEHYWVSY